MKKTHYPIHSDFKRLRNLHPPLNRVLLRPLQWFLGIQFHLERKKKELDVKRLSIPASPNPSIQALLYSPKGIDKEAPCLLYCHGGGFVLPSSFFHFYWIKKYAQDVRCHVLFIDYRLAPRYPYPAAPQDCFESYKWLLGHASELSVDPKRIGVAGDSAGGCLAAVVTQMAKDEGIPMPCLQLLIYPATGVDRPSESMEKYVDTPMCNTRDMEKYGSYYLEKATIDRPVYLMPTTGTSFVGFPPSYVETAEFDCLRDHGICYANNLKRDGVEVVLNNTVGTVHGFDIEIKSMIVKEAVDKRIAFLKEHFK
ncbi:MAG: alpha/beta hydrolase [Bacilli bacterium]|nr:alpha/beta hydrolase [Bacilli bacterium]